MSAFHPSRTFGRALVSRNEIAGPDLGGWRHRIPLAIRNGRPQSVQSEPGCNAADAESMCGFGRNLAVTICAAYLAD
jgi:hypothetical protein